MMVIEHTMLQALKQYSLLIDALGNKSTAQVLGTQLML